MIRSGEIVLQKEIEMFVEKVGKAVLFVDKKITPLFCLSIGAGFLLAMHLFHREGVTWHILPQIKYPLWLSTVLVFGAIYANSKRCDGDMRSVTYILLSMACAIGMNFIY